MKEKEKKLRKTDMWEKEESNKGKEVEKRKLRKISRERVEEKEGKKSEEKGEKVRKTDIKRVGGGEMV